MYLALNPGFPFRILSCSLGETFPRSGTKPKKGSLGSELYIYYTPKVL